MTRRRRIVSLEAKAECKSSVGGPRGMKGVPLTVFSVPADVEHPLYRARLAEVEQFLAMIRAFLVEQRSPDPADFDEERSRRTKRLLDEIEVALTPVFYAHLRGKKKKPSPVPAREEQVREAQEEERRRRKSHDGAFAAAVRQVARQRGEKTSTVKRSLYPRSKK